VIRHYPIVRLSGNVRGIYFFLPGDVELIERAAHLLAEQVPPFDIIVAPEVGAVPLAHALGRLTGRDYLIVRKAARLYMDDPVVETVRSITTQGNQNLVVDGRDLDRIRDRRVLIIDDVVSTGGTLDGLARLVSRCAGHLAGVATVFLEGDQTMEALTERLACPVAALGHLPLYPDDTR